ncbi:unnamed protein product [Enterobius vermicularis]|uniref:Phospholipid scramblase n=1 Tax=Enterobius vermicularis TaxID=51028 RepID=A0A0N4UX56_ENTVE|nr:unnamed protein product [Enterobius vermicularis]
MLVRKCPCIVPKGAGRCFQYSHRYQASTLEEALNSFPDLTMEMPVNPTDGTSSLFNEHFKPERCASEECIVCQKEIRERVFELGLRPKLFNSRNLSNTTVICTRYRFSQPNAVLHGIRHGNNDIVVEAYEKNQKRGDLQRFPRQLVPLLGNGNRYVISCTTKGITPDPSGMLSLCSCCWTWRSLPRYYFPTFINELICDTLDGTCLSGYAACVNVQRTVQVLRIDTGAPTPVNIQIGSHCECKIRQNSPITRLIMGRTAIGSTVPQFGK